MVWTRALAEQAGLDVRERPGANLAELAPDAFPLPDEVSPPPPPVAPQIDWGGCDDDYGYGYG